MRCEDEQVDEAAQIGSQQLKLSVEEPPMMTDAVRPRTISLRRPALKKPKSPGSRELLYVRPALPLSKDVWTTPETTQTVQIGKLSDRPLPPIPIDNDSMAVNNSNAFPPLDNSMGANRAPASNASAQVNGNGNGYVNNYMPPLPVGHQQDLTFLYQQIQELSGILQSNRDRVDDVTRSAEEIAVS